MKTVSNLNNINLQSYDYIIVAFSGGKDSTACILGLLEAGAPKEKIALWHHDIDGRDSRLMDWPCTPDYCRKFAAALNLPIFFSWKTGGYKREMFRNNQLTAPIKFEDMNHVIQTVGGTRGKHGTRMKFPQVSPDLRVRWCTAYLKIDVGACAIRNQKTFIDKRTLFITGERAQESACRAKYNVIEPDRADNRDGKRIKRYVDHYRPVHSWTEKSVWDILERWKIIPHPCYRLGWGRCSCSACIFGNKNQWASLNAVDPEQVKIITDYEKQFGLTINRTKSVPELIASGTPYEAVNDMEARKQALSPEYTGEIITSVWKLPAGAFGENAGPS